MTPTATDALATRKRILVICPFPEDVAPGQRLKYEQYFPAFREAGYDVVVSPFKTERLTTILHRRGHIIEKVLWTLLGYCRRLYDLGRAPLYDVVYVFLWVTPFGPPIFERFLALANANILYDIDDMIYAGQKTDRSWNVNWFIEFMKGRSKPIYLMRKAKHVIVCTPTLHQFASQHNDHVTDISSTIDTDAYVPVNTYSNEQILTIGWSGSYSTVPYLHLLDRVFLKLQETHKFRLFVMGDDRFQVEGLERCEAVQWTSEDEIKNLQQIDIGVYPLPREEWVRGKSGLKALQYMALGIPTIATAIGANYRVIENDVSGLLVKNDEQWLEALKRLLEDPALRKRLGEKGRERVVREYSLHANKGRYIDALESLSATRSGSC